MSTVQTKKEISVDDVRQVLSNELGSRYRVNIESNSTLKVGRSGVIPSKVTVSRHGEITTFKIATTGLIVSRIIQATSINPRIKRALKDAQWETQGPE